MEDFFGDLDTDPRTAPQRTSAECIRAAAHVVNGGESAAPCRRCGGSGRVRIGYSNVRMVQCYGCSGRGTLTRGQVAAAKGKETRALNHAAWLEVNADLVRMVRDMAQWSDFARQMDAIVADGRDLTENQAAAIRRTAARAEESRAVRAAAASAERVAKSGEVDVSAISALFATATDSDIKRPIFRTEQGEISRAPATGRNAGALYVKSRDDVYLGKIVGSQFRASREAPAGTLDWLRAVAADPTAEAIKYARRTGRCGCCGHQLVDPVSIRAGIGPVCAEKWGLDYRRELARESLRAEAA